MLWKKISGAFFSGAHPIHPPLDLPLVKGFIVNYFQSHRKGQFSGNPSSGHWADEVHFEEILHKKYGYL